MDELEKKRHLVFKITKINKCCCLIMIIDICISSRFTCKQAAVLDHRVSTVAWRVDLRFTEINFNIVPASMLPFPFLAKFCTLGLKITKAV